MFTCLVLMGCGLPSSGPTDGAINRFLADEDSSPPFVLINDSVLEKLTAERPKGIPTWLQENIPFTLDMILPGDQLTITVYENISDGLFGSLGGPTIISELRVDTDGMFVFPYAGPILAAGKTTGDIRNAIFNRLAEQTPDPQILVRRLPGTTASISILGDIAGGTFPFDGTTRTLLRAISVAGGVGEKPEATSITLIRGNRRATMLAARLLDGSIDDVNLHPKDVLIVERSSAQFVALGYIGAQALIDFPKKDLSLIEALGLIGGLNPTISNPSGVFIFRHEDRNTMLELGHKIEEPQARIAYGLDMRNPGAFYTASNFMVKDNDVIYVTEATFSRLRSILNPLQSTAGLVEQVSN